jgi:phage terminase Nu1 subunit (DNA packaging protein)
MNNNNYSNFNIPSYQPQDNYLRIAKNNITLLNLNNELRRLWEEHIIWTKLTIRAIANNDPDTGLVTNRLLRNATDFGQLFLFFYNPSIAENFAHLMREHLTIAADLVNAAKKGDNYSVMIIDNKWHKNADEIARFLNSINPYFNEINVRNMLYEHLALTKDEAISLLTKKYENAIRLFDEIEIQALMMSDMFLEGLARQFSNQIIR